MRARSDNQRRPFRHGLASIRVSPRALSQIPCAVQAEGHAKGMTLGLEDCLLSGACD